MDWLNLLLKYIIAFCVGLFVITYVLKVPFLIAGKFNIVNDYYIKNFKINVPLDELFTMIYLLIFEWICKKIKLEKKEKKTIFLALLTGLITFSFCFYYLNKPKKNDMFSKWYHTVGYKSAIYDIMLVVTIYLLMMYLDKVIQ